MRMIAQILMTFSEKATQKSWTLSKDKKFKNMYTIVLKMQVYKNKNASLEKS
mgnify:CR=1 FL=1